MQKEWRDDIAAGVYLKASPSAHVNKRIFADFGCIFITTLTMLGLRGRNILLIFDSHKSHVLNWEFIHLMHANNVTVLSLPAHTTHCMQPMDRGPFYSLKHHWNVCLYTKIAELGGRKLTRPEWFQAFLAAYERAMTVTHIQNAFRVCGIYPLNRQQISDERLAVNADIDMALDSKLCLHATFVGVGSTLHAKTLKCQKK